MNVDNKINVTDNQNLKKILAFMSYNHKYRPEV